MSPPAAPSARWIALIMLVLAALVRWVVAPLYLLPVSCSRCSRRWGSPP